MVRRNKIHYERIARNIEQDLAIYTLLRMDSDATYHIQENRNYL